MIRVVLIVALFLFAGSAYSAESVQIESQRLAVNHQHNRAEFIGKVELTRGDFYLECDRLVAHYKERAGGELEKAEAFGHVKMRQGEKNGHSDEAIYDQKDGKLTLIGNAEMVEPGRTVKGEKIVHYLESTRTEVLQGESGGRVQLSIDPDEGEDEVTPAEEKSVP